MKTRIKIIVVLILIAGALVSCSLQNTVSGKLKGTWVQSKTETISVIGGTQTRKIDSKMVFVDSNITIELTETETLTPTVGSPTIDKSMSTFTGTYVISDLNTFIAEFTSLTEQRNNDPPVTEKSSGYTLVFSYAMGKDDITLYNSLIDGIFTKQK